MKVTPFFIPIIIITSFCLVSCNNGVKPPKDLKVEKSVKLVRNDANKKVDVFINGKLFTAYIYPTGIKKPVLYPLTTTNGTKITRKYPLEVAPGERIDHPHHVGLWFNYGDVNGIDFWNNSAAIKAEDSHKSGTIKHQKIINIQDGKDKGTLEVSMNWLTSNGEILLEENTKFIFGEDDDAYFVDRITTLFAKNKAVYFKDNKEGMLGIRVTRQLEHPSNKPEIFSDANGNPTDVAVLNNEGVNGKYLSSEGVEGTACWGKRANWVNLRSTIGQEKISLVILDHTSNVGYPTYWHARGYGLFAANPLGQAVFSKGKEVLDFKLAKGEKVTFNHRIIVASRDIEKQELDSRFDQFSKEK